MVTTWVIFYIFPFFLAKYQGNKNNIFHKKELRSKSYSTDFQTTIIKKYTHTHTHKLGQIMLRKIATLQIQKLLKYLLSRDGFTYSKQNLVLRPNYTSSNIIEDGSSMKAAIRSFPNKTRQYPTRCFHDKLVSCYRISGLVLVSRQKTFLIGDILLSYHSR